MQPFTKVASESVGALGEEPLIREIRRWLGSASPRAPFGIGDDCAVLPGSRGPQLITVDPVIYGRHFDASVPARAVGAKLLKRNLSDLAAMGGRPTAGVLALTLDAKVCTRWLEAFYRGLAACARQYHVAIVGGDIAQAPGVLAASLTLLGHAAAKRVLTRRGASVGDHIFVTGELGGSLQSGHHHRFVPRIVEGVWLAQQPDVNAMMDVSDGLAKDVHALTPKQAWPALLPEAIPQRARVGLRAALTDGEDYELVFAVAARVQPERFLGKWQRVFPKTRLSRIGSFLRTGQSGGGTIDLSHYHGYEHLR
jgi:thiamine-monophosphate kinase